MVQSCVDAISETDDNDQLVHLSSLTHSDYIFTCPFVTRYNLYLSICHRVQSLPVRLSPGAIFTCLFVTRGAIFTCPFVTRCNSYPAQNALYSFLLLLAHVPSILPVNATALSASSFAQCVAEVGSV